MSEHLDACACAEIGLKIEKALLNATVISVAATVDESGSIEIDAIRLRLRDGRIVRIRAPDYADEGILVEAIEERATRKMSARQDFGGDV